ncbi:MAG: glutathione S-transferase family protein [Pseudomonadota bacterium]
MTQTYRIIGSELSPFSVKVRSWFRFKGIRHEWTVASAAIREQYSKYFRIPVIPVVITPDKLGLQDSTPIIEQLDSSDDGPSIHPEDQTLWFLSCLLEEFGDEWANKWMFHFRWAREADRLNAATKIAAMREPDADIDDLDRLVEVVTKRMSSRTWFVGSNEQNSPHIESGFKRAIKQLNTHLQRRKYLLGNRPAFADFGIAPQIYNAFLDPTAGALISARYPDVVAWLQRMLWPRIDGDFETWESLSPTLAPFISEQVGARFLPWSAANRKALQRGEERFSVELPDGTWTQSPQKYHAKSLTELQNKYQVAMNNPALHSVLEGTGCLETLQETADHD